MYVLHFLYVLYILLIAVKRRKEKKVVHINTNKFYKKFKVPIKREIKIFFYPHIFYHSNFP